jgi:hypothetical protein
MLLALRSLETRQHVQHRRHCMTTRYSSKWTRELVAVETQLPNLIKATAATTIGNWPRKNKRKKCVERVFVRKMLIFQDIQATASEIRFLKQSDLSATRNALRLAQQAEQTGRDTLSRLGDQGERIHNAERHLAGAAVQNRLAEEKTRELKTL